jgi:hypothetical protein
VHNAFHVSQLKKYLRVLEEQILMKDLDAKENLSYKEYPIKILETSERVTSESRCARCNGVTILKKKLLGKEKKN